MDLLLEKLGLDIYEARVYLALLELGKARVSEISKKALINRTTGYDILERLIKYGLITKASGAGTRQKYTAEPPSKLVKYLEGRKSVYERRIEDAKTLVPQLAMLYKTENRPIIKFYEGAEGVKEIYSETLKSKKEILSCLDLESWAAEDFRDWGKSYNRQRAEAKIKERILVLKTPKSIEWFKNYPATLKYTQFRWLDAERFPFFNAEINIFEDKLMIALLKKPGQMGIMIQSVELTNILKALFELAWEMSK